MRAHGVRWLIRTVALAGVLAAAAAGLADDWPMLNHDPQRTCATGDQPDPPFRVLWTRDFYSSSKELLIRRRPTPAACDAGEKLTEQIASGVQAVVAGETVYVPTLSNRLYALDAATGRTRWRVRLGTAPGAIPHSPAVAAGLIFAASLDRHLYALDARTGEVRWRFRCGPGGFWNSPLPLAGRLYVGSRDGCVYALDAATGRLAWKHRTGGPVLNSPSSDGRRIYVASDDRRVYCLGADDGRLHWRSAPLPGRSARWYCPVIAAKAGVCFVTTSTAEQADWVYGAGDGLANVHYHGAQLTGSRRRHAAWQTKPKLDEPYDAAKYRAEQDEIARFLRAHPAHRTLHALDLATGREKFVAPVLYRVGCGSVPSTPAVGPDGCVYVLHRSFYSNLDLDSFCVFGGIGRLAPDTGRVELLNQSPASPRPLWGNGIDLICDESAALTVGGGRLYVAHSDNTGTMDIATRQTANIYGDRDLPGKVLPRTVPFSGTMAKAGQIMQCSPTEWHGPGRGALSIAGKRLFWVTAGIVVALESSPRGPPWQADGPRREPPAPRESDAKISVPDDAALRRIVWQTPRAAKEPETDVRDLQAELQRAVGETVEQAPWAPFDSTFGRGPWQSYFQDVSETFYALALALPHLRPAARKRVADFLRAERAARDPLTASYPVGQGRRREHHVLGPHLRGLIQPIRTPPEDRLYRLWAYHYYTATPVDAATWARYRRYLRAEGEPGRSRRAFWYASENAEAQRWIGLARLAALAGDTEAAEAAAGRAVEALKQRLAFERTHRPVDGKVNSWDGPHDSGGLFVVRRGNSRAWIPRWRHLTPEIGRLLRLAARADTERQDRYVDVTRPVGFLAWGPKQFEGEVCTNQPHQAMCLFQAKAYISQQPGETLRYYADVPWCKADLYYIEKLVAAIRASGPIEWVDVRRR